MSQLEILREKLYKVIETGDIAKILKTSQELDVIIFRHMEVQINKSKQSA